jgi:hypothetical protein
MREEMNAVEISNKVLVWLNNKGFFLKKSEQTKGTYRWY